MISLVSFSSICGRNLSLTDAEFLGQELRQILWSLSPTLHSIVPVNYAHLCMRYHWFLVGGNEFLYQSKGQG